MYELEFSLENKLCSTDTRQVVVIIEFMLIIIAFYLRFLTTIYAYLTRYRIIMETAILVSRSTRIPLVLGIFLVFVSPYFSMEAILVLNGDVVSGLLAILISFTLLAASITFNVGRNVGFN